MKIVRYLDRQNRTHHGRLHADGTTTRLEGDILGDYHDSGEPAEVAKILVPIVPSDILCIGLNYHRHAEEGKQAIPEWPVLFMKNGGTLQNPGDPIVLPRKLASDAVDYECELAVVIGKPCKNVSKSEALQYVLGYTCVNDVTARDLQMKDGQWTRGKGFDTFCAVGPCLVPKDELRVEDLRIRTLLDGQVKQDAYARQMIFPVDVILSYVTAVMTLEPGDLIATGTPPGVGPMQPGSKVRVEIEGIGVLENEVLSGYR